MLLRFAHVDRRPLTYYTRRAISKRHTLRPTDYAPAPSPPGPEVLVIRERYADRQSDASMQRHTERRVGESPAATVPGLIA